MFTFRSVSLTCTNVSQIEEQIAEAFLILHNSSQKFQRDGSGWSIDKIVKMEVNSVEYSPLVGSSYIPLPQTIQTKSVVLNIQNSDQKCFLLSVHVTYTDHPARVPHYTQYEHEFNMEGIDFPIPLSQIKQMEKQNGISIHVLGLDEDKVYPLHVTSWIWTAC